MQPAGKCSQEGEAAPEGKQQRQSELNTAQKQGRGCLQLDKESRWLPGVAPDSRSENPGQVLLP